MINLYKNENHDQDINVAKEAFGSQLVQDSLELVDTQH